MAIARSAAPLGKRHLQEDPCCTVTPTGPASMLDWANEPRAQTDDGSWSTTNYLLQRDSTYDRCDGPRFLSRVVCRADGPTSSLETTRTLCTRNPWGLKIPPEKMQQVVLIHYHADQLCMWKPAERHSLAGRTVYVHSNWKHLNHFGNHERNYSHWLENVPNPGTYPVWKVMLDNPDMANPQKRDASALRLLSWLSFSLDSHTSALLGKLMKQLATYEENDPVILRTVQNS